MTSLKDKVAIVTGASGGIGLATSKLLAEAGARVLAVDKDEAQLSELYDPMGDSFAWHACDVADEGSAAAYVNAAIARFGGVDILHANAGIEGKLAPIAQTETEDFDRVLAVNVRGVFLGIRAVVQPMVKRGGGSIIVTSSGRRSHRRGGLGPTTSSTASTRCWWLMKTAAVELGPQGIRVNSVNPGPIENRMMRSIRGAGEPPARAEAVKQGFEAQVPLGRYGLNDEIARLVRFLASDDASYCNGAILRRRRRVHRAVVRLSRRPAARSLARLTPLGYRRMIFPRHLPAALGLLSLLAIACGPPASSTSRDATEPSSGGAALPVGPSLAYGFEVREEESGEGPSVRVVVIIVDAQGHRSVESVGVYPGHVVDSVSGEVRGSTGTTIEDEAARRTLWVGAGRRNLGGS